MTKRTIVTHGPKKSFEKLDIPINRLRKEMIPFTKQNYEIVTLNYPPNVLANKVPEFTYCTRKKKFCYKTIYRRKVPKMCMNFHGPNCTNLPCSFKGCFRGKLPSKECVKLKCFRNLDVIKLLKNTLFRERFSKYF